MQHDFQECEKEKDIFALESQEIRMSGKNSCIKRSQMGDWVFWLLIKFYLINR